MRTAFTAAQLADPGMAAAAKAVRSCVHCGFCNATCPTYQVLGDERDGPRGRIQIMQAMLETGAAPSDAAVRHIDRCLTCLSCRTTCPSGVDYARLVDEARLHIAKTYRRPREERWFRTFLGTVLPRPFLFRLALRLAPLSRLAGSLLPEAFKRAAAMAPDAIEGAALRPGVYPAQGARRMRVLLMRGCVQETLAPEIDRAAVAVLTRLGAEVVIPRGGGCCGALNQHMGEAASARRFARANVAAWGKAHEKGAIDRIVSTASGCGAFAKDYAHLLAREAGYSFRAGKLATLVRDVSEVAAELGYAGRAPERMKVAYQAACSLQHGQKVTGVGEGLLAGAGFELAPVRDAHLCCGSAGHYSLLQPEMAGELRRRKVETLTERGAEAIVSGNIGCIQHLRGADAAPTVHLVEMLDWASGGAKPARLAMPADGDDAAP